MKTPLRQCAACREHFEKRDLLRIVRKPDGTVEPDDRGKTPGRGVYICRKEACLDRAIKQGAFARSLGTEIPPEVTEEIRRMIREAPCG